MLLFQPVNWGTVGITLGIMAALAILLGVAIMVISRYFNVEKDSRIDEIVENNEPVNDMGLLEENITITKATVDTFGYDYKVEKN